MEYDERLANFRQTRLNPFDRGEEEDGLHGGKTPPLRGNVLYRQILKCNAIVNLMLLHQDV